MDREQVRKEQKIKEEIGRKKVAEVARRVMEWKKNTVTEEMLVALAKIRKSYDEYILLGKCKDYAEYKGRCYARNEVKTLPDLIESYEKTFNKVLEAERRNI